MSRRGWCHPHFTNSTQRTMPLFNRCTITIAVAVLGASASASAAQDSASASTQFQPTAAVRAPALPDSGMGPKTFFTKTDLIWLGSAAVVTGAVMPFDKRIERWWRSDHVQASPTLRNAVNSLTKINETPLAFAGVVT
jgi:hypothetical protein